MWVQYIAESFGGSCVYDGDGDGGLSGAVKMFVGGLGVG
jgi:hypothetical protein